MMENIMVALLGFFLTWLGIRVIGAKATALIVVAAVVTVYSIEVLYS